VDATRRQRYNDLVHGAVIVTALNFEKSSLPLPCASVHAHPAFGTDADHLDFRLDNVDAAGLLDVRRPLQPDLVTVANRDRRFVRLYDGAAR
jgi:hypothetical protein